MTIYIATWGDPLGWSPVDYLTRDGVEVKSFSTLSTYHNPSKVIIIAQDSVLTSQSRQNNQAAVNCRGKVQPPEQIQDYPNWVSNVKTYIECVAKAASNFNVTVLVVPAIGEIGGFRYGVIKMDNKVELPTRYYGSLLETILVTRLYDELKDERDEVVLDTTHGVNYLPSIALPVLTNLTSLLNLKFKVINYVPTVLNSRYTYAEIFSNEGSFSGGRGTHFDIEQINEGKAELEKRLLIKALRYNGPLVTLALCRRRGKEDRETQGDFLNSVKVEGKTITITKRFERDLAWVDVIYDFVCDRMPKENTERSLNRAAEEVFGRFSSISKIIIRRELQTVFQVAQKLGVGEERDYSKLLKYGEGESDTGQDREVLLRNFVAHAGLPREHVKVKRGESDVFLEYKDSVIKMLETIFEEEGIKDLVIVKRD